MTSLWPLFHPVYLADRLGGYTKSEPGKNSSDDAESDDVQTNVSVPTGYMVLGESDGTDTAGVLGRATASNGNAFGVVGETNSSDSDAAASLAKAQEADAVRADARGGSGNGLQAFSDTSYFSIYAVHEGTGNNGAPAIYASNQIKSDAAILAVGNRYGSDPGIGLKSDGHIQSTGHVQADQGFRGQVGSSAHLSSNQAIDGTLSKIPFDETVADQRGEFDTGNHWFECKYDGVYQVTFGIESASKYSTNTQVHVNMDIDQGNAGSNPAGSQGFDGDFRVPGAGAGDGAFARTFSKTVYGLLAGNRISVSIKQTSESSKNLAGGTQETFLEVRQVA